jgi:hypothetical protein
MSTKTYSNNMVSPNDHVVMNHQNHTPNKWHMRPCSLQQPHPKPKSKSIKFHCGYCGKDGHKDEFLSMF